MLLIWAAVAGTMFVPGCRVLGAMWSSRARYLPRSVSSSGGRCASCVDVPPRSRSVEFGDWRLLESCANVRIEVGRFRDRVRLTSTPVETFVQVVCRRKKGSAGRLRNSTVAVSLCCGFGLLVVALRLLRSLQVQEQELIFRAFGRRCSTQKMFRSYGCFVVCLLFCTWFSARERLWMATGE